VALARDLGPGWESGTGASGGSDHVARARRLVPLIAASGDQIEQDRRLPVPLFETLADAGLYRMLLPRSLNGDEVDPVTFVRVIEEVAKADASTAWCLCQASGCSMVGAYLSHEVAWDIFGSPRSVLAWGPGPARAVAVEGGYRVSGTWSFASGGRQATWLGGYCPIYEDDGRPRLRADGAIEGRTMLFPATSAVMTDVWQVVGLRGTGSDSFTASDLFVPHPRSVARDTASERRVPGLLYCFPSGSLYASGFAGVALGLARTVLDALVELARDKTVRGGKRPLRENEVVQSQVAQAEARLRSARAFLLSSLDDIWRSVGKRGSLALDQRMLIRLAATHAIHEGKHVVDTAYHAAGATAIFSRGPFERRFRDMHAVTQQLQGRQAHFETVGQFLLGLDPDTAFL
jgi:alkylation response protein AidB-like acyl-CoA dehydrogenase